MPFLVVTNPRRAAVAVLIDGRATRVAGAAWVGAYWNTLPWYLRQWDGAAWVNRDPTGTPFDATDVLWFSNSDVWYSDAFSVYRWNGAAWSVSLTTAGGCIGMYATSTSNVYAVLSNTSAPGLVDYYQWNGAAWAGPTTVNTGNIVTFYDLTRTARGNSTQVRVAAASRLLNLTTATEEHIDVFNLIGAIWMFDNSNGYATTVTDEILIYNGAWAAMATQPVYDLVNNDWFYRAIDGTSMSNVWAVGLFQPETAGPVTSRYLVQQWNGTTWTRHNVGGVFTNLVRQLLDVRVIAANDVWVVGYYPDSLGAEYPDAWHWDGATWTQRQPT